jgi:hypothetical protein
MANLAEVLKNLRDERGRAAAQLRQLDEAIGVLGKLTRHNQTESGQTRSKRPRRKMSAAARRKIAAAQKKRWAKWKARQAKKAA